VAYRYNKTDQCPDCGPGLIRKHNFCSESAPLAFSKISSILSGSLGTNPDESFENGCLPLPGGSFLNPNITGLVSRTCIQLKSCCFRVLSLLSRLVPGIPRPFRSRCLGSSSLRLTTARFNFFFLLSSAPLHFKRVAIDIETFNLQKLQDSVTLRN
jgi:hypothetical protein